MEVVEVVEVVEAAEVVEVVEVAEMVASTAKSVRLLDLFRRKTKTLSRLRLKALRHKISANSPMRP
jgi:hypothetical protein